MSESIRNRRATPLDYVLLMNMLNLFSIEYWKNSI